jgi:4-hydroxy-4-methyl-2-oxoglutarate aldolase
VGHAHVTAVRWNCEVEVFGRKIQPGQLIHADKHGFLVIPAEDASRLLEAAQFMDANECSTVIAAARQTQGKTSEEILADLDAAGAEFGKAAKRKFKKTGEW